MKSKLLQYSVILSILSGCTSCSSITYGIEPPPYQTSICGLEVAEIDRELPILPFQPEPRLLVFISDLHLGVGKYLKNGKTLWHKEEDFRWGDEFKKFLEKINHEGKGATDLILNGDTFELWQSTLSNCNDGNVGCTEEEALKRIKTIISQHSSTLKAIGRFAKKDDNRVIIIPGNHDAALLYPAVSAEILNFNWVPHEPGKVGLVKAGKVRLAKEGFWLSSNGLVYAEHGHQIGRELNCLKGWPAPFVRQRGEEYLERSWGEQFVIDYYNPFEKTYPIIDNIANEADAIRYGLKTEDNLSIVRRAGKFVKFFFLDVSWDQFKQVLSSKEGDSPKWDIPYIRKKFGNQFVLQSFPKNDPFRKIISESLSNGETFYSLKNLSDENIRILCNKRAGLSKLGKNILTCPIKKLGAIAESLFSDEYAVMSNHLEQTFRSLVHSEKTTKRFEVFVYSHTHRAKSTFYPMKGSWRPGVVNSGAWQRVVTVEQLRKYPGLQDKQVLPTLRPEDLPPCYGAVLIRPYSSLRFLNPQLQYWQEQQDGSWDFSDTCDWKPRTPAGPRTIQR